MTYLEQAIKIAVDHDLNEGACLRDDGSVFWYGESLFLKPAFWQALGFGLGWGKAIVFGKETNVGRDGYINAWQSYWHDFIDHLAEGKAP